MSKYNTVQTNFSNGEISPKAQGRVDLEEYFNALSRMENFLPKGFGGAFKRPGTQFEKDVDVFGTSPANGGPALLPFVVSKTEAYTVVIRPNGVLPTVTPFIRIYKNDAPATEATISPFNYILDTLDANLEARDFVFAQSGDLMFVTHASGTVRPFVISRVAVDTFQINEISTALPSQVNPISPVLRHPYRATNTDGEKLLQSSATSGAVVLTAKDSGGTPLSTFFDEGHVHALFKITEGTITGVARITSLVAPSGGKSSQANAVTLINFPAGAVANPQDNWNEDAWSTFRGFPTALAIYQERMVWGGTTSDPGVLFFSLTKNLFHMMEERLAQDSASDVSGINYFGSVQDTDPFQVIQGSTDTNKTSWLASGSTLLSGTLGAEYNTTQTDAAFSKTSQKTLFQTGHGARPGKVVQVEDRVIYVTRDGKKVRDFRFNLANGSNISINLSLLADHLSAHGVINNNDDAPLLGTSFIDMTYQASRDIVWVLTNKNDLVGITISDEAKTIAWHKHIIGGNNVNIWGVTSIPNEQGTFDELWLIVERNINSSTTYYLERMGADFNAESITNLDLGEEDIPIYMDSLVDRTVIVESDTITGLSHLEGETVLVTINGIRERGTFTVSGGQITLSATQPIGTRVLVGLAYTAQMDTVDVVAGGDFGRATGIIKRTDRVTPRFYKTYDAKVLRTGSVNRENIPFGSDVFTGLKRVNLSSTPDEVQQVTVISDEPYPCNVLNMTLRGVAYD